MEQIKLLFSISDNQMYSLSRLVLNGFG